MHLNALLLIFKRIKPLGISVFINYQLFSGSHFYRKASEGQTRTYTIEFSVKNTIQKYIDAFKCNCY